MVLKNKIIKMEQSLTPVLMPSMLRIPLAPLILQETLLMLTIVVLPQVTLTLPVVHLMLPIAAQTKLKMI